MGRRPAAGFGATRSGAGAGAGAGGRQERLSFAGRAAASAAATAADVEADPVGFARASCLRLLERGPRTRAELAAALAKKGVPDDAAEQVLSRFTEVGMIDDALFASLWVASRHRGRGLASRALSQELRRKGVDGEVAQAALEELDPEQELATARAGPAQAHRYPGPYPGRPGSPTGRDARPQGLPGRDRVSGRARGVGRAGVADRRGL